MMFGFTIGASFVNTGFHDGYAGLPGISCGAGDPFIDGIDVGI